MVTRRTARCFLILTLCVTLLMASAHVKNYGSDVFLSSEETARLLESEGHLLDFIYGWLQRKYVDTGDSVYDRLSQHVKSDKARVPTTVDLQHPLHIYLGLRRFTAYWHNYVSRVDHVVARSVHESLARNNIIYPDNDTLRSVRTSIVRLQAAYNLSAADFVKSAAASLTDDDVISFVNEAEFCGLRAVSDSWGLLRFSLSKKPRNNTKASLSRGQSFEKESVSETESKGDWEFYSLCREFVLPDDIEKLRSEKCRYLHGMPPIQRWKTEILSSSPYIALIYDFVTDKESKTVIDKASSRLERALTGPDPQDFVLNTERRLSKASWFQDTGNSVFNKISHRIEQVTGLKAGYRTQRSFGEAFQVVNYGVGGLYTPHYDFFKTDDAFKAADAYLQDSGDRAATFMIYLGNVTQGGATVFPRLGIGTPPIKNAALFWYNFAPEDGLRDNRTLHGGCPVITGHKWVTNKWIHEVSTAMTQTCRQSPRVKPQAATSK